MCTESGTGKGSGCFSYMGRGGSSSAQRSQREYLTQMAEVILIDLPGRVRSGGAGCGTIDEYVNVVRTATVEEDLAPMYVVGHSMGGLIALSFAIADP